MCWQKINLLHEVDLDPVASGRCLVYRILLSVVWDVCRFNDLPVYIVGIIIFFF